MKPTAFVAVLIAVFAVSFGAMAYGVAANGDKVSASFNIEDGISLSFDGKNISNASVILFKTTDNAVSMNITSEKATDVLIISTWNVKGEVYSTPQFVESGEFGKEIKLNVPEGSSSVSLKAQYYLTPESNYATNYTFHFNEELVSVTWGNGEIHDGDVAKVYSGTPTYTVTVKDGQSHELATASHSDCEGMKTGYNAKSTGTSVQGALPFNSYFEDAPGTVSISIDGKQI